MPTFTPPVLNEVSPIDPPSERHKNPLGNLLFRYYDARSRGAAVFKYTDGTYSINRNIAGLSGVKVFEPYPALEETSQNSSPSVVNDALAWSWYASVGTQYPLTNPVSIIYYGGRSYTVTSAEAASLVAAGFGAYVT